MYSLKVRVIRTTDDVPKKVAKIHRNEYIGKSLPCSPFVVLVATLCSRITRVRLSIQIHRESSTQEQYMAACRSEYGQQQCGLYLIYVPYLFLLYFFDRLVFFQSAIVCTWITLRSYICTYCYVRYLQNTQQYILRTSQYIQLCTIHHFMYKPT